MRNQVFAQEKNQLQGLLSQFSSVGIIVGQKQNLDTMGSALALYLALLDSGKQVQIVSPVSPLVEISNLVAIDQVKDKFEGDTRTVVISVPYKEGEVEKVSFTTEGDRMNFNIVGGPQGITPFDTQDIRVLRKGSTPELTITVGVSHIEELQTMVDVSGNVKIVNIDNSPDNSFYGDVIMTDPGFSSVSEIVTSIIDELGLPLDMDTAQNLLDGITSATQNFSSQQTSSFAFEAAGVLLRVGAKRHEQVVSQAQKFPRDFGQQKPQPVKTQPIPQMNTMPSNPAPIQEPSNGITQQNPVDSANEEVPSDWFVPKVFKSSKNPNQQ